MPSLVRTLVLSIGHSARDWVTLRACNITKNCHCARPSLGDARVGTFWHSKCPFRVGPLKHLHDALLMGRNSRIHSWFSRSRLRPWWRGGLGRFLKRVSGALAVGGTVLFATCRLDELIDPSSPGTLSLSVTVVADSAEAGSMAPHTVAAGAPAPPLSGRPRPDWVGVAPGGPTWG